MIIIPLLAITIPLSTTTGKPLSTHGTKSGTHQGSSWTAQMNRNATNWCRTSHGKGLGMARGESSQNAKRSLGSVSKPCNPVVHIKIAGKWMFIPLKMVCIGIDPYPHVGNFNLRNRPTARIWSESASFVAGFQALNDCSFGWFPVAITNFFPQGRSVGISVMW